MRIALVSPYDMTFPSGVNAHVEHLAVEMRRRGHDVRTFAPGPPQREPDPYHITLGRSVPIPSGGSLARVTFSPSILGAVRRLLEREPFDVIHLHEPLVPALPPVFLRYSRSITIGTFHAAHEGGSRLYWLTRPLLRRWAARLDGRIAVSPAAAVFSQRYFPGDYEIIPNGVDVERFQAEAECPGELAGLRPYILFVGRFEPRKGLPVLLQAFRILKARHPGVSLVAVGDGARRGEYEAWVRWAGLRDVHFAGFVPGPRLPAYYQHAAAFCAPNTGNESFGIVLLEAMAAGAPVVASDIPGFRAVVTDGRNGVLVPPRDAAALAAALERLLLNPDEARALARAGREHADAFAWPRVAERVLEYYGRVAARARP